MKAIIVAAWHWTRTLPITKTIPKELLPVGDKPVVHHIVNDLVAAGIRDIIFIVSDQKKALIDYFSSHPILESALEEKGKNDLLAAVREPVTLANYTYVYQNEPLWTAHAVWLAQEYIDDDFLVVFGDAIYPPEMFTDMIDHYNEYKKPLMVAHEVDPSLVYKYGVFELHDGGNSIKRVVEKPSIEDAPSNLVSNWVYLLPPEIFSYTNDLMKSVTWGERHLPVAIQHMIDNQRDVHVLPTRPFWDIGSIDWWLAANAHYHHHRTFFK